MNGDTPNSTSTSRGKIRLCGLLATDGRQVEPKTGRSKPSGNRLTTSIPSGAPCPVNGSPANLACCWVALTFSERCQEYDRLGFDCVEVHRGREQELFDSGEIPACSRENQDVIVGYFVRRSD